MSHLALILIAVTLNAIALAGWAAPPPAAAQPKEYVLKYSELGPPAGARAQTLMWWAQEIESRTGGRVKVQFSWSESLTKAQDTLRLVGAGVADAGTVLGIYNPVDLPIWNLANAPFGESDPWVGMRTWQEMRQVVPELRREAAEHNVRILMNFTTGAVDILSKAPIVSEADLKGKRIRAAGGWTPLFRSLGATTVNLTFPEAYEAFAKGRIDGAIAYIPSLRPFKLYEVAGHLTDARMGQVLGFGAGVNLTVWNGLPEQFRAIITEVSDTFIDRSAQAYFDDVENTRKALSAGIDGKRVQFHALAPGERERWAAKSTFVDDWVKRMGAQGVDSRRIVETLGRVRAKYEAELAAKGYPWARR